MFLCHCHTDTTLGTSDTRCVGVFFTPDNSLTPAGVLRLTQFWHCLPGDGIRSHRLRAPSHKGSPASDASYKSSGCHLCFWLISCRPEVISCKLEVPTTPSLASSNLWEWLTDFRKTVCFAVCQFIQKEYDRGYRWTSRLKRWVGQACGRGQGSCTPSPGALLPCQYLCVQPLQSMCFGDFMEASSVGMMIVNSISSPSLLSGEWGISWKFQASNHGLGSLVISLHPEAHLESSFRTKDTAIT